MGLFNFFMQEIAIDLGKPAGPVVDALAGDGILAGVPLSRLLPDEPLAESLLLVAVTETVTDDDMDRVVAALKEIV